MPRCPHGMILRRAYRRRDGTYVRAVCVRDVGKRGKTPSKARVLPTPTRGALGKYGYTSLKTLSAAQRRTALQRAVKAEGYATIVRRVNLVANFNKRTSPKTHATMRSDIAWLRRTYRP